MIYRSRIQLRLRGNGNWMLEASMVRRIMVRWLEETIRLAYGTWEESTVTTSRPFLRPRGD